MSVTGVAALLSFFLYNHGKPDVQQGPNEQVEDKNDIGGHPCINQQVGDHNEGDSHELNQHQGPTGGEAHLQELVMQVGTVRLERMGLATDSTQYHTTYIQAGYQQHTEGGDQRGTVYYGIGFSIVHTVLDGHQAQDITEGQTAGIAHEDFMFFLNITKDVIAEEGDDDAYTDECQQGIHP